MVSRIDKLRSPFAESVDFQDLLQKSTNGESVSEFRVSSRENFLVIAHPLMEVVEDGSTVEKYFSTVWGYIVTLTPISRSTQRKIQTIQNTFESYKQQKFP